MRTTAYKNIVFDEAVKLFSHTIPCWICGKKLHRAIATVDHVYPKSKGGKDISSNYRIACKKCNGKKGSKIVKTRFKPAKLWNGKRRAY